MYLTTSVSSANVKHVRVAAYSNNKSMMHIKTKTGLLYAEDHWLIKLILFEDLRCVCVCVRACVRASVRVFVRLCVCLSVPPFSTRLSDCNQM